jgi:hypothetical protein
MLFARYYPKAELLNNIKMNDETIPLCTSTKYLGLTLDSRLNWKKHLIEVTNKARSTFWALNYLLSKRSRLNMGNKLLLYKAVIRPQLAYGAAVWGHACKTHMQIIERFQNVLLRKITRAPWFVRNSIIRSDIQTPTMSDYTKSLAKTFFADLVKVGNAEIDKISKYDCARVRRPRAIDGVTRFSCYVTLQGKKGILFGSFIICAIETHKYNGVDFLYNILARLAQGYSYKLSYLATEVKVKR